MISILLKQVRNQSRGKRVTILLLCALALACVDSVFAASSRMARVKISANQKSFVLTASDRAFIPWGFNYDHDENGRLMEDYWQREWAKVEEDFREMKQLGANVVRVHLQLGKFMTSEEQPNRQALRRLARLLRLSERLGLYLDITGLGCYHKKDVPAWYETLSEERRWAVPARFWQAIARQCKDSPAIFCYDLMNEPVVPGGGDQRQDWLGPPFAGKHFVQFVTLDIRGRKRSDVAQQWISRTGPRDSTGGQTLPHYRRARAVEFGSTGVEFGICAGRNRRRIGFYQRASLSRQNEGEGSDRNFAWFFGGQTGAD